MENRTEQLYINEHDNLFTIRCCNMCNAFVLVTCFWSCAMPMPCPTRTLDPCIAGALRYLESKHISTRVESLYILERTHQETSVVLIPSVLLTMD